MSKAKKQFKRVKIDSTSDAILLNRYVAFVTQKIFAGHIRPIKTETWYQVQWKNIWMDVVGLFNDLKKLLTFDFQAEPRWAFQRIYYSLIAFWFIFQGKHLDAHLTAFFIGAVSYDSAAETSHSGEPSTISWNITIGSNSDRLVLVNVSGLADPNDPTFDSGDTRRFWWVGATKVCYKIAPGTGSKTCAAGGGNIKVGGAISLYNVDQQAPIGSFVEEDGSSSPNTMTLVTQEDGSMRVDVLGSNRDDSNNVTASIDVGTLRHDAVTHQNQFRIGLFGSTEPKSTAGSAGHVWTTNGFNRWYVSFEVKAVLAVPTIDGTPTGGFSTSVSHTVPSGTKKLVIIAGNHQGTISNVQWNGASATKRVGAATAYDESIEIWEINNPTAGTGNITATFSGGSGRVLHGINVMDADTGVTPDTASDDGSSSDALLTITTTHDDCLIIDACYSEGDFWNDDMEVNPEQIKLFNEQSASYENVGVSYGEKGTAGSRDLQWRITSSKRWAYVAIAIPLLSGPTLKSESDTGSGVDAISVVRLLTEADTGSGVDALSVLALLTIAETGSGVDAIAILAMLTQTDTATGVDAISLVVLVGQDDTGSGVDDMQVLAMIPVSDTGLGADILSILALLTQADTGSGEDAIVAFPTIDIADTGSGVDLISILAMLTLADTGSGADAIDILAQLAISDTAVGSDAIAILAMIAMSDTASGVDAIDILAQIAISDSATAVDAIGILAMIAVTDSAQAVDALDILNSLNISDTGTALDQEAILALISEADSGSGEDEGSITNFINVMDTAVGSEVVELLSLISIADSGQGDDSLTLKIIEKIGKIRTTLSQSGRRTALSQRVGNVILKQRH